MKGSDFLTLTDFTREQVEDLLFLALELKKTPYSKQSLNNKTLAMLFSKTSTRTRISFEVAMTKLGGHAINLNWFETNFVKGDIVDESKILGLYCDAVMARLLSHDQLLKIAEGCDKPVINGMDDRYHPCQALADLLTILEEKGRFEGLKIGWVGDGTNVCNSLMHGAQMFDINMVVATPKGYEPTANTDAIIIHDPQESAKDADVLVTDTWVSLGQEKEKKARMKVFPPFQLNSKLLSIAKNDCIVLHCLPAKRGYEITSKVIDSPQSKVLQEAENRLHTSKALLLRLLL